MSREKRKGELERMLKQDEHSERNAKENKTRLSKKVNIQQRVMQIGTTKSSTKRKQSTKDLRKKRR